MPEIDEMYKLILHQRARIDVLYRIIHKDIDLKKILDEMINDGTA